MKKILAGLLIGAMIVVPAYADFDYSVLDELDVAELNEVQDYVSKRIEILSTENETELQEDADEIIFNEVTGDCFLEDNRSIVQDALMNCNTVGIKKALQEYLDNRPQFTDEITEVIDAIDNYGDYSGIIKIYDTFSNETYAYYEGYTDIDENHYFFIEAYPSESITFGFIADDWLFANGATLRIMSVEDAYDNVKTWKDTWKTDILDGGKVIEKAEHRLYDSEIDYLLNDMSGDVIIRFSGKRGNIDYALNDMDKKALSNCAKYIKLRESVYDIYWKYYVGEE